METILVQIINSKAYQILEDLEDLHTIKLLKKDEMPKQKLSDKNAGKLPSEIADKLLDHVLQSRTD
jgi:hypothetical protein